MSPIPSSVVLASDTAEGIPPLAYVGAVCFGLVVGYITYRTLARTTDKAAITDLATVVGAVGGGFLTTQLADDGTLFGLYAIGLAVGMAIYLLVHLWLRGRDRTAQVLGGDLPQDR